MTTAQELIEASYRLAVQTSEGETPSAQFLADALEALNLMLDSWSTERLMIYQMQDQEFTWPADTATRTLGASGNFVGNRPIFLDDATYFVDTSTEISYPITIINQLQYNSIAEKTTSTTYPQFLYINNANPNATISLYPVPNKALEFHFVSALELSQPATLATTLAFPPGYKRAFKYNLTCELAAELGIEPSPTVQRIAMTSKRNLKRINNPMDVMRFPGALVSGRPRFDIFAGE